MDNFRFITGAPAVAAEGREKRCRQQEKDLGDYHGGLLELDLGISESSTAIAGL